MYYEYNEKYKIGAKKIEQKLGTKILSFLRASNQSHFGFCCFQMECRQFRIRKKSKLIHRIAAKSCYPSVSLQSKVVL